MNTDVVSAVPGVWMFQCEQTLTSLIVYEDGATYHYLPISRSEERLFFYMLSKQKHNSPDSTQYKQLMVKFTDSCKENLISTIYDHEI